MTTDAIVEVRDLVKQFTIRGTLSFHRDVLVAVAGVSFEIARGETFGLVGESGSGKSTVANIVAGLLERTSGTVTVDGVDFASLRSGAQRRQRRHVQVVFQDPYASLAPMSIVESSVLEPLRAHRVGSSRERRRRVDELLDAVQLDRSLKSRFPSELSGGQLQRVSIARALALNPKLLVLDEPVSALDVSTKAEIVNLLADLKDQRGLSYLFISHDLSTLRTLTDRVGVMYLGELVEQGPAADIYDDPKHPYTRALLASVPVPDPVVQRGRERIALSGDVPSPLAAPSGCSFHPRCPAVMPQCSEVVPPAVQVGASIVRCHLYPPSGGSLPVGTGSAAPTDSPG